MGRLTQSTFGVRDPFPTETGGTMERQIITLKYHENTYKMLGVTPRLSRPAVSLLDRVETQRGFELPASLREWYSLEGATDLLFKYSNADPPVRIEELGEPARNLWTGQEEASIGRGLLPFRFENQGCFVWAVRLNGSEDPPVVVSYNEEPWEWHESDNSFAVHLYLFLWDYFYIRMTQYALGGGVDAWNEADYLRVLRASGFEEKPTGCGSPITVPDVPVRKHRFERRDQRVLLWVKDDSREGSCLNNLGESLLAASTEESLRELAILIRREVPRSSPFKVRSMAGRNALGIWGKMWPEPE